MVELPRHLKGYSVVSLKRLVADHRTGNPERELDGTTLNTITEYIEQYEADQADAYERNDPKHPTYAERMLDAADMARKSRREDW